METNDHKNPISSGRDGHGGIHVCHKCGWPYPNPHPSSKIRRSHKKVCGTVDKYRLDNDAQEKTLEDGYDGEPTSDDEFETPSDNGMERTISRRSNRGVGSRSSRSNRSEEEVFTDAGTEFNESPAIIAREASGGAIQRFYSMQNENELDDSKPVDENPISGEHYSSTTDLLKDNQLQTVPSVEGEKEKVKADMASEADISTNDSLGFTAATLEMDNAVDQNLIQSSEACSEMDIGSERGKEILLTKDELEPRTPDADKPEKTSLLEVDGLEDNGGFNVLERDKIEGRNDVDSSRNFYSPVLQGETNFGNDNISKSGLVQECNSKIGIDDNVYALDVPDVLPLKQLEDLDHIKGKNNVFEDDSVFASEKQEESQKSVEYKKSFGEPDHISEVNSVNADVSIFKNELIDDLNSGNPEDRKDSGAEEKKPVASNIFGEGAAMSAGKTTSNPDSKRSNFEDDGEYFTVIDNDVNKVSEDDVAVRSLAFIKPTLDEVTLLDVEHFHTSNDMGEDENITVEGPIVIGNEIRDGAAMENVGTEIGLATAAILKTDIQIKSSSKVELNEGAETSRQKLTADDCSYEKFAEGASSITVADRLTKQHVTISALDTVVDHINSSSRAEIDEDNEPSRQSLTAVNDGSIKFFAEGAPPITEGARETNQHVTISAIDANLDSGSVTDSLDGNWGSVSVMSTTSDATPTADSIALNRPEVIEGKECLNMVPKPVNGNQRSEIQLSVKSEVKIEQMESSSEIQSSKKQQCMSSALQMPRTPTVAAVANERNRANKGKEIISKVTNWDSGNQNTPLKTLLGEATARSRAESPINHNQSSTSKSTSIFMPKKDVIPVTNDGFSSKTENVNLNSDQPEMESAQVEMGKEWDSPARCPVKIKTEKSRSKNRGYWVPFLCCSSVNAR